MFIFSSNSAKYSFEYKVSKLYNISYNERILITPTIMSVKTDKPLTSTPLLITPSFGNVKIELRDLLLTHNEQLNLVISPSFGNVKIELRDLLISYMAPSTELDIVNAVITDISGELKDVLISHQSETDTVNAVLGNLTGELENV